MPGARSAQGGPGAARPYLGGQDGLDLLRHWRARRITTPVIASPPGQPITDRLEGLDEGRRLPESNRSEIPELLSRVRAVHRRHRQQASDCGSWVRSTFRRARPSGLAEWRAAVLSAREFRLLTAGPGCGFWSSTQTCWGSCAGALGDPGGCGTVGGASSACAARSVPSASARYVASATSCAHAEPGFAAGPLAAGVAEWPSRPGRTAYWDHPGLPGLQGPVSPNLGWRSGRRKGESRRWPYQWTSRSPRPSCGPPSCSSIGPAALLTCRTSKTWPSGCRRPTATWCTPRGPAGLAPVARAGAPGRGLMKGRPYQPWRHESARCGGHAARAGGAGTACCCAGSVAACCPSILVAIPLLLLPVVGGAAPCTTAQAPSPIMATALNLQPVDWLNLFLYYSVDLAAGRGGAIATAPDMHQASWSSARAGSPDVQFNTSIVIAQSARPERAVHRPAGWNVA